MGVFYIKISTVMFDAFQTISKYLVQINNFHVSIIFIQTFLKVYCSESIIKAPKVKVPNAKSCSQAFSETLSAKIKVNSF